MYIKIKDYVRNITTARKPYGTPPPAAHRHVTMDKAIIFVSCKGDTINPSKMFANFLSPLQMVMCCNCSPLAAPICQNLLMVFSPRLLQNLRQFSVNVDNTPYIT